MITRRLSYHAPFCRSGPAIPGYVRSRSTAALLELPRIRPPGPIRSLRMCLRRVGVGGCRAVWAGNIPGISRSVRYSAAGHDQAQERTKRALDRLARTLRKAGNQPLDSPAAGSCALNSAKRSASCARLRSPSGGGSPARSGHGRNEVHPKASARGSGGKQPGRKGARARAASKQSVTQPRSSGLFEDTERLGARLQETQTLGTLTAPRRYFPEASHPTPAPMCWRL
jgi:hypothetical protein